MTCKVLPGDNKALAEAQPRRFYLPDYVASKGWVALRLDIGKIDWSEVKELLLCSYVLIASKRLAERVKARPDLWRFRPTSTMSGKRLPIHFRRIQ